jgi:hypothetical protein
MLAVPPSPQRVTRLQIQPGKRWLRGILQIQPSTRDRSTSNPTDNNRFPPSHPASQRQLPKASRPTNTDCPNLHSASSCTTIRPSNPTCCDHDCSTCPAGPPSPTKRCLRLQSNQRSGHAVLQSNQTTLGSAETSNPTNDVQTLQTFDTRGRPRRPVLQSNLAATP